VTLTDLGYEDVRLYDGSWNEWNDGSFPVEQ
jgi:3-mercaptopyruvate sulfurtransferase SseA